jgi:hypothetical protein
MIKLRFVHNHDAASDAILFDTGGLYSHVEAVTPEGKYLGARAEGGVLAREPDYDTGRFNRQKFVEITCDDLTTAKFYHYLNAVVGEPYDFAAIRGFIFHLDDHGKHLVICSALQTLSLRWCMVFANQLTVPAHEITPRDLELILSTHPNARTL